MATKREKQQAQALADLEFDPQFRQIRDLWGQSRTQYLNDLRAARNRSRSTQQVALASKPRTRQIFETAKADLKTTNSDVDKAMAAVGPGTPSGLSGLLATAMQRERGAASNRLTNERASALADAEKKYTGAEAGKTLAYTTAKGNLLGTRKELTQKLQDLSGDKGNKISALLGEMVGARSDANAKSRASASKRITSGPYRGLTQGQVDSMSAEELRDYEKKNDKATGKGKGGANGRATNDQIRQLSDDFNSAIQYAQRAAAKGISRAQIAKVMLKGQSREESPTPVPKFGQLPTTLALDMAYDKHISRANAQRLHQLGYKVNDLTGAVSYTNRPKPKPKPKPKPVYPAATGGFANPFS